jgi:hypothetical protein
MKMLDKDQVESEESVERRARSRLRPGAVIKAALLAGLFVYVVPAGGPWMSQEAFTNVMGRVVSTIFIVDLIGHFLLALLYGWVLGACIFRPPTAGGIILGTALAGPLWGLNFLIFAFVAGIPGNELHTLIAHLEFGLCFSVAYRALAVPRPRITPTKSRASL